MLRHFLTDNVFQSGIVRYLRKYSYKNAQNQDLWDSLANVRTWITFSVLHSVLFFDIILKKDQDASWQNYGIFYLVFLFLFYLKKKKIDAAECVLIIVWMDDRCLFWIIQNWNKNHTFF